MKAEHVLDMTMPKVLLARRFTLEHPTTERVADCCELSLYVAGSGTLYSNEQRFSLKPGGIRFSLPGTKLSSTPKYTAYTVYFQCSSNKDNGISQLLDGIPAYFATNSEFLEAFSDLVKLEENGDDLGGLRQSISLLQLLTDVHDYVHKGSGKSGVVVECMAYLETHFSHDITLDSLGALFGYSGIHLLRLFQKNIGQSPHVYLTEIRMRYAKKMLMESELSLNEIAQRCGFHSDSHFKALFRKLVGMTPGNYRRSVWASM